jgi:hypothetical protein
MMKIRSLINGLVVSGVAFAMVSTLAAQTVVQASARVARLKGSARYKIGSNTWQPLKRGDVLRAGALVETGGDSSYVDLVLGEGGAPPVMRPASGEMLTYHPNAEQNMVRVWENSRMGIDILTVRETGADVVTETQLDLQAGHIFGSVRKMSAASKYEVKIPNAVASIRGTIYDISVEGLIKVRVGSVFLNYTDPNGKEQKQVIMSLQQFDMRTGVLSPLPDVDKTGMINTITQLHVGLMMPVTFTVDSTLGYISPH